MNDRLQVLGLKPGADSERVQRAYRRAVNDAEREGNKSKIETLEAAHTKIMMSGLSARLQVGVQLRSGQCCNAGYFIADA